MPKEIKWVVSEQRHWHLSVVGSIIKDEQLEKQIQKLK